MKVLIAAGGTGGHIYPGIAVANEIVRREPDSEVLFVGTARGLETKIVRENGFHLSLINSSGLKNVGLMNKLKGLSILPKSFVEARKIIRQFRPHVVVGAGGYVSGPVLMMAAVMGYPTMIMDSNALPGFTNRQLARFVDRAALTFEQSLPYFGDKGVVIGNPVRSEFFQIPEMKSSGSFHVLAFGGSQGSRAINEAMVAGLPTLAELRDNLAITHQTGETDFETVKSAYAGYDQKPWDARPYISDIFVEYEKADLLICRAGATTCAEVAAAGRAAIFIPLPTAADDHQRKNAEALVASGAAKMILQKDLTGDTLAAQITELLRDRQQVEEMAAAAKRLARPDAAERAVELITELKANA